ncbi:hypothetical protein [Streptomyces sp. ODS28]|uniref:hypothetical protein n=1 Tax=Streptomyces sp. ODS28 TaxID=3136688 RepID=UPI0031EF76E0
MNAGRPHEQFEDPEPHGPPDPYGQGSAHGRGLPYGQGGNPYGQGTPYGPYATVGDQAPAPQGEQFGAPDPYGPYGPYGQQGPQLQPDPYGQGTPYGEGNPYGQPGPYGQPSAPGPYGEGEPQAQQNPYGAPYGSPGPYNPYGQGQPGAAGQPGPYGYGPQAYTPLHTPQDGYAAYDPTYGMPPQPAPGTWEFPRLAPYEPSQDHVPDQGQEQGEEQSPEQAQDHEPPYAQADFGAPGIPMPQQQSAPGPAPGPAPEPVHEHGPDPVPQPHHPGAAPLPAHLYAPTAGPLPPEQHPAPSPGGIPEETPAVEAVQTAERPQRTGSPIVLPGLRPAAVTAVLGALLAALAPLGHLPLAAGVLVLQALTAAGWFRLNGMWPARQGIALAFLGGVAADVALLLAGPDHTAPALVGTLGVWCVLNFVLHLRNRADPDERLYGLTAAIVSSGLTILASGLLTARPEAVTVGAGTVAVTVLARTVLGSPYLSTAVALLAAVGAGVALAQANGLGPGASMLGLAAAVCALVGVRVAGYDFPSRFVHMTAGVALPLTLAAPAVHLLGRALSQG